MKPGPRSWAVLAVVLSIVIWWWSIRIAEVEIGPGATVGGRPVDP